MHVQKFGSLVQAGTSFKLQQTRLLFRGPIPWDTDNFAHIKR